MYKYYYRIEFFPIKTNEEGKDIHDEIFNNIPHLIKTHMRVDCLQDGFVIYTNRVILSKI